MIFAVFVVPRANKIDNFSILAYALEASNLYIKIVSCNGCVYRINHTVNYVDTDSSSHQFTHQICQKYCHLLTSPTASLAQQLSQWNIGCIIHWWLLHGYGNNRITIINHNIINIISIIIIMRKLLLLITIYQFCFVFVI